MENLLNDASKSAVRAKDAVYKLETSFMDLQASPVGPRE